MILLVRALPGKQWSIDYNLLFVIYLLFAMAVRSSSTISCLSITIILEDRKLLLYLFSVSYDRKGRTNLGWELGNIVGKES